MVRYDHQRTAFPAIRSLVARQQCHSLDLSFSFFFLWCLDAHLCALNAIKVDWSAGGFVRVFFLFCGRSDGSDGSDGTDGTSRVRREAVDHQVRSRSSAPVALSAFGNRPSLGFVGYRIISRIKCSHLLVLFPFLLFKSNFFLPFLFFLSFFLSRLFFLFSSTFSRAARLEQCWTVVLSVEKKSSPKVIYFLLISLAKEKKRKKKNEYPKNGQWEKGNLMTASILVFVSLTPHPSTRTSDRIIDQMVAVGERIAPVAIYFWF